MADAISPQALSELIGSIYDCALDPKRWDQTLCELRDAFKGDTGSLALFGRRQGRILINKNVGLKEKQLDDQATHAPEMNARMAEWVEGNLADQPHVLSRHFTRADWESSPYFSLIRKEGFVDIITLFLIWGSEYASVFAVGRLERRGVISEREIELGRLLLPHLRRAVTISKVLDARAIEKARMAEALDALKCGVVLTDASGAILHANRAAGRMLPHGWTLQDSRGVLAAKLPGAAKELRNAIKLAAQDESALGKTGLAIRLSEEGEAPVFAHVLPLTGGELRAGLEPEAVAAVFIGAAQDEQEAAQAMAAAYGLTPAETRLLESLLAGHTLAETATALGVAMTTAKTHLDNLFQKTGVNRQAELMRLAARAAPPAGSQ
jgi:DNA-binding CsgD family transcriptional regulator/PAS domain-containing protein